MEAAMFLVVAQTRQTKHPLSFYDSFSLMFGRGGWGEGCSAATCIFTTLCHEILHNFKKHVNQKQAPIYNVNAMKVRHVSNSSYAYLHEQDY